MAKESDKINISLSDMTDEDKKTLLDLIKKYSNKKNKRWKPEHGDQYYYITGCGVISLGCYANDGIDNDCFNLRNCFKTIEEAKFELERRKIIAELQNYADEYNTTDIDWNNNEQEKHFIYYCCSLKMLNTAFVYRVERLVGNEIYFTSQEIAESAIKHVGKNRILKYVFGIEVDENEEK